MVYSGVSPMVMPPQKYCRVFQGLQSCGGSVWDPKPHLGLVWDVPVCGHKLEEVYSSAVDSDTTLAAQDLGAVAFAVRPKKFRDSAVCEQFHDQSSEKHAPFGVNIWGLGCAVLGIKTVGLAFSVDREPAVTAPVDHLSKLVCYEVYRDCKTLNSYVYKESSEILE